MKILLRSILSAVVFTSLWSTWAYFANVNFGSEYAKKAAITQGSFTLINSFVYTLILEFLLNHFEGKKHWIAFLIPNLIVSIVLPLLHIKRGTPNVFFTVLPVLLLIYLISGIYTYRKEAVKR
ncbi:MAG: hypothetical protein O9301_00550 [Leptospira sp.]|nr:hypothetical protein [Leptospira sp.]